MNKIWKLGWRDLVKGLVVVVLMAVFAALLGNLDMIPYMDNPIVRAGVSAFLAYLMKNLATDENGKLGGKL